MSQMLTRFGMLSKDNWEKTKKTLTLVVNAMAHFKEVCHCLNANIYSYLETSGGQSSNLYLNVVHFSTPVLIRHLWQLKTVVFLHSC